ncbi:hypothetical protein LTR96_011015 [Exophiala xenobiotica]|nr:hypothetical protein H2202_010863 [Exophiala xenobiotica]KAK5188998.1 hypothetical protein LTR92_011015 [Exophiala xenobiotica]KAK5216000.1 hypothetical protein LTR72_010974 [Exophiala xenobiotica]KAK5263584.1 hypothetical protein LTR96_011015 [Exophiala xenobiotica]KAK5285333.1 hypothetical protein LTR14_011026 [Exophiala xenobiotica]
MAAAFPPIKEVAEATLPGSLTTASPINTDEEGAVLGAVDSNGNTYPDGGRAAWLKVLGSFCAIFPAFSLMNTTGTWQVWLSEHQLADDSQIRIAWIFGFYGFLSLFAGLQWGPMFDAYGPRTLAVPGAIGILTTYCLMGICKQYWQFFLVIGLLGGLSTSLLFVPAISTIQHWFLTKRGITTGIAISAGSLAGIILPVVLERLFVRLGFGWSTRVAALILLPFTIASCVLMESRFHEPLRSRIVIPNLKVFRRLNINLLTVALFSMELAFFIPLTYMASYAISQGMSTKFAFNLMTILNVGSLIGRWLPGYLGDRLGYFNVSVVAQVVCIVAMLGLWLPSGSSHALLVVAAFVFGVGSGSNISLTPVCLGQLCKVEEYGAFYTSISGIASFGALLGVPIAGGILTATNDDYTWIIVFGGLMYVIVLVAFLAVRVMAVGWKLKVKF